MGLSRMTDSQFTTHCEFLKVDEALGLVFGFAIICTENGEPFIDLQDDHCPDEDMVKAGLGLMSNPISTDDHAREADGLTPIADGRVPFVFPLTADIAKAMGIETKRTGLMIGMKPSPEVFEMFKNGERKAFSIGGSYGTNEEVELP